MTALVLDTLDSLRAMPPLSPQKKGNWRRGEREGGSGGRKDEAVGEGEGDSHGFYLPPSDSPSSPSKLLCEQQQQQQQQREELLAEVTGHLSLVAQSADCLLTIADTVLDLSRIDAGLLLLDCAPFSLRETVGSTMRMLQVGGWGRGRGGGKACWSPAGIT